MVDIALEHNPDFSFVSTPISKGMESLHGCVTSKTASRRGISEGGPRFPEVQLTKGIGYLDRRMH